MPSPQAEERGVQLSVVADAAPAIAVDPDRLGQVIGNLVGNALRHTPDGGHIQLAATVAGPCVVLSVTDDGPGIPTTDLPHIFERFYRGDKARVDERVGGWAPSPAGWRPTVADRRERRHRRRATITCPWPAPGSLPAILIPA
jgi:light-regulated signal transduction histidine kinase (bacteriophytochrome)